MSGPVTSGGSAAVGSVVPVCPELRWASSPITTPIPPRIRAAATAITVGSTQPRPRTRKSSSAATAAVGSVSAPPDGRTTVAPAFVAATPRVGVEVLARARCAARPSARSSVPVVGILGHPAGDDVVEGDRKAWVDFTRSRGRRGDVGRDQILKAVTRERNFSRQRLVQHTRQRVDIDRRCTDLSSKPFGRHVIQGADLTPGSRQPGVTAGLGYSEVDKVRKIGRGDQRRSAA